MISDIERIFDRKREVTLDLAITLSLSARVPWSTDTVLIPPFVYDKLMGQGGCSMTPSERRYHRSVVFFPTFKADLGNVLANATACSMVACDLAHHKGEL